MRRWFVVLLASMLLLAGCSTPAAPAASETPGSAESAPAFPLTLPQEGGALTLESMPERVYVVDNWSLDIVVGLGITPVGAATYFPPSAWLAGSSQLDGVEITTVGDALPLEKIAAARPDLIVDLGGSASEDTTNGRLAQIAPVLYSPKDWLSDGWRERIRHAGAALGRSEAAEKVIGEAQQTLTSIRTRYPQLTGAPLTFARLDPPASFTLIVDDSDFTRRFLNSELGFVTPKAQVTAYGTSRFTKVGGALEGVSLELGDLVDADADAALIWFQDDKFLATLDRQEAWRKIPVVAEQRLVPMAIDGAIAFRTPTPASIAWAADNLLPDVAAAVTKAGQR